MEHVDTTLDFYTVFKIIDKEVLMISVVCLYMNDIDIISNILFYKKYNMSLLLENEAPKG